MQYKLNYALVICAIHRYIVQKEVRGSDVTVLGENWVCWFPGHWSFTSELRLHRKITMAGDVVPYYTVTALVPTLK